ncbi:MAG TPA: c-type cytochrome [Terracidiphilus sp.]|jgi:mono/diheme cytochrome c family protein
MKKFRKSAILTAAVGLVAMLTPAWAAFAAADGQNNPTEQVAQPAENPGAGNPGAEAYKSHCAVCHGEKREGNPPGIPPLVGIKRQMTDEQITALIRTGKGGMPAFPAKAIPDDELAGLLEYLASPPAEAPQQHPTVATNRKGLQLSPQALAGSALFQQNCAFCHGRDAMGGEAGPDLTRSKLVLTDPDGSQMAVVVREGRTDGDKKMPAFRFSDPELASLVAFIRARVAAAEAMKGNRRGVDVADLQTGDVEAGKTYFNGAGGCAKCHSPVGDLAGIASRYQGLQLEERMLYPRNVKSTVTVTLPDGHKISGTLAYRDEFTIALTDSSGTYKSWPAEDVKYTVDSPVNAHVELFGRYTDDDIHNLMAYLQTLR